MEKHLDEALVIEKIARNSKREDFFTNEVEASVRQLKAALAGLQNEPSSDDVDGARSDIEDAIAVDGRALKDAPQDLRRARRRLRRAIPDKQEALGAVKRLPPPVDYHCMPGVGHVRDRTVLQVHDCDVAINEVDSKFPIVVQDPSTYAMIGPGVFYSASCTGAGTMLIVCGPSPTALPPGGLFTFDVPELGSGTVVFAHIHAAAGGIQGPIRVTVP